MKGIYCCVLFAIFSINAFGQSVGDFRSFSSGNWNSTSTWERWNGSSWVNPAPNVPNFNDGAITILSSHAVTITGSMTIDQVSVQSGGSLTLDPTASGVSFTVTLNDGAGDDLVLNGSLALLDDAFSAGGKLTVNGSILVNSTGSITNSGPTLAVMTFSAGSVYQHNRDGGAVPKATWNTTSTCLITGIVSSVPTGLNQSFGNFEWSSPGQSGNKDLALTSTTAFKGSLRILDTGSGTVDGSTLLILNGTGTGTIVIQQDLIVSTNGRIAITNTGNVTARVNRDLIYDTPLSSVMAGNGTATVEIKRHFTHTDGTFVKAGSTGSATFLINGTGVQNYTGGAATPVSGPVNFTINTGSTLNLGTSALMGDGTFTLNAGATIHVKSPVGLNSALTGTGNIQTAFRTYIAGGNIVYNGTDAQLLGDEWSAGLSGIAVNLDIDNLQGVTNDIPVSTSLVGKLTLTRGAFNIGNANTLIIEGPFDGYNGTTRLGTISGDPELKSNLTFAGSGTITGTLNLTSGAQTLQNLTIDRSGTIQLGTDLTISTTGTLSFPSTGNLYFNTSPTQTLTVNGNITQTGSGGLFSGVTGANTYATNLVIGGSGALSKLPFCNDCGTTELVNVSLNRTGAVTYPWASAVRITGKLDLNSGTLAHSSGLIMTGTSTFERSGGTQVTGSAPAASPTYSVAYVGDLITGLELPSNVSHLNNLTVAGNVTLDKAIQINGDVNINSGTLNASSFNLTMAGDDFLVNGGSFTMASDKIISFSRAGTTSLSGSTLNGIQFGNLTISSGTALSVSNALINVSGTWDNQGSFAPDGGTVAFNGTNQSVDGNGQPFNNVLFSTGGTKSLEGSLDVNGDLTIASGVTLNATSPTNIISVAGVWSNSGTFVHSNNTVLFDGGSQIITETGSFYNLQLAGSGTKTLGRALDVDKDLIINSGVTFTTSATAYPITLGGNWINNGTFTTPGSNGTITFNGTTNIAGSSTTRFRNVTLAGGVTAPATSMEVAGNWVHSSGTFTPNGGTVIFNGNTTNQTINPNGQPFNHVTIAGVSIKTLQGNLDINGNLTLTDGTLNVSTSNYSVSVAGSFDASGGGTLNAQAGTFTFDGAGQTITSAGEAFFNTVFGGTGTKSLADNLDVDGNVTITSTVAAGANTINVAGNWNDTGTFSTSGVTVFNGADQTIRTTGSSFEILTIAGTGTKTLQDALDVRSHLSVTATLDVSASNYTVAVGGNWDTSVGSFNARSGEVRLNGGTQTITSGANTDFYILRIAGTGTKMLQDALDVNSDLIFANNTSALNVGADQTINIAGHWVNDSGSASAFVPANGKVIFDGGATSNVRGTGTTLFNAIDVTGTTRVEIESAHNLRGTLTLVGNSSQFDAQGTSGLGVFALLSTDDDPAADARIAPLPVPANFTGMVTVQRFMSKETQTGLTNNRIYRYISSPVANAAVSDIQNEIPITGSFTGASNCSGCGTTDPSMFYYDESVGTTFDDGWVAFPSVSNSQTLEMGRGYGLFVWGNTIPSALWDVRGPIYSGNISLPVTYESNGVPGADGFNLVGNPYPSAIDWSLIYPTAVNIANAVYIRDNANGRYTAYVNGMGSNGGSKDIAMGQAFWVEATGPNPQLPITENMKSASAPFFFRIAPPTDLLRVTMRQSTMSDEMIIRFEDEATDEFDAQFDARKLRNAIFNLSSVLSDNSKLAINTLGAVGCGRLVPLHIDNVKTGHYELFFDGMDSFSSDVSIRLVDSYTGDVIDPKLAAVYGFDVDLKRPETFGGDRFSLTFEFSGSVTAPTLNATDVCYGKAAQIELLNTNPDVNYSIYSNNTLVSEIGAGNGGQLTALIPQDKLTEGVNTFELRAVNAVCSEIAVEQNFEIKTEAIPQVAKVINGQACGIGEVSLVAEGAEEGNYRWYEAVDDTEPIAGAVGGHFVTPEITKTKTYYVSAVNSLGCEGPRVEVRAEVVNIQPVTVEEVNGQLVSSYASGNQWYLDGEAINNATGQTFVPTVSGTYTVEVNTGQCVTSAEWSFLVTGNEETSNPVSIYPNPVKKELIIRTKFEQVQPPVIADPTGKIIGEVKMLPVAEGWEGTFDFSGRNRGVYILRIIENGVGKYKRIVKE